MPEEKLGNRNVFEGPRVCVIPSNPDKNTERMGFDTPYSTFIFKEKSMLAEFFPKANKNVP